ncbi:MAG: hypothetical protein E7563_07965 [Ruminococcaceae bacterium]|nr:hypothetical protein [Oscillospiraceae bacterium]
MKELFANTFGDITPKIQGGDKLQYANIVVCGKFVFLFSCSVKKVTACFGTVFSEGEICLWRMLSA